MPAVDSGLVLVTGASGFLGTYVVQELLKRGFQVRAVVRDTAKGEYVRSKFPSAKYVIVKEMNEVSVPCKRADSSQGPMTRRSRASTPLCTSRRPSTSATPATPTR